MTHASATDLLNEAKALVDGGRPGEALARLRALRDLGADFDYALCNKAAKLAAKIIAQAPAGVRPVKLALLSSSTTVFFEPILKYFALLKGIALEIRAGDFGNWRQDILNAGSWLYAFDPDFVLIATHYRDAALPAFSADPSAAAEAVAADFEKCWELLAARSRAAVFQYGFDSPADDAAGYLAHTQPGARARVLQLADAALCRHAAARGVTMVDLAQARALAGAARWEDARLWSHARQHPAPESLPVLAAACARAFAAKLGLSKKVCVLDLDNTLWGGVIGEDGLDGIRLGAPDAAGEGFAAFQYYLKELQSRGIVLAVCSKNNEADALLPFEKHPAMRLKRADFAVFSANWNPKSQNIAAIATALNLGLDSFVFVDDNPAEIQEVSAALPQVACVLLPKDPAEYIAALARRQYFDAVALSEDDLRRNEAYQANAQRERARAQTGDMDDFLRSLDMRCAISPVDGPALARTAQLLGKTNQFNLTTRRYGAEAVERMANTPRAFARCFQLADRFGDNGVVGILIALPAADGALEVDTFVMSCRVIGRGLEQFMFDALLDFARQNQYAHIRGVYLPTPKNAQTADLYPRLGFVPEKASPEASAWLLDVAAAKDIPTFIARA